MKLIKFILLLIILITTLSSCKKEQIVFENNTIPVYSEIPTITIKNYINRLYIDIIGREPLNSEMETDVSSLRTANLSSESRRVIIGKLMLNSDSLANDISYKHAYFNKLYNDTKARLIEGVSNDNINQLIGIENSAATIDSLEGNWESYQEHVVARDKLQRIIDSQIALQGQEITVKEMYRRMMFNAIYDEINMNSFNFIQASYNNIFYRYPSQSEFDNAYNIIEFNIPSLIFGQSATNKNDYLNILTNTNEFETGLVQWIYLSILSREPNSTESFQAINTFHINQLISDVQVELLITDEYAGFN